MDQQWAARGGLCLDEEHSPDLRRPEIFRDHEDQRFTYEELFLHNGYWSGRTYKWAQRTHIKSHRQIGKFYKERPKIT